MAINLLPEETSNNQAINLLPEEVNSKTKENLFQPLIETPSSSLARAGYETYKNPTARATMEMELLAPLGLGEAPLARALLAKGAQHGIGGEIAELAGIAGKNALVGAGLSAAEPEPITSLSDRLLRGLAEGAGIGAVTGAASPVINALRPSRLFAGSLTPEELTQNLETTRGTNTNIGDVTNSPFAKRLYENILAKLPFSGVSENMAKTANQVKDQGVDILNRFKPSTENLDYGQALRDALVNKHNENQILKRDLYSNANKIAENEGLQIDLTGFKDEAGKALGELTKNTLLRNEAPGGVISDLQHYVNPKNKFTNPATGEVEYKFPTLSEANITKSLLNDEASKAYENGDSYIGGIYSRLAKSMDSDIKNAIETKGSDKLKNEFDRAQKFYASEIAPFEQPEIAKFVRRGGDPDLLLSNFIKQSRINDRGNLINKLKNTLPIDERDRLLPYAYLSRSVENGEVNPMKLRTLVKSLGNKQKQALFSNPEDRKAIENYIDLVDKNVEPLTMMANPKTGQRNMDLLPLLMTHSIGGLAGYGTAGLPGALLGGTVGIAAPGIASKPLVNYMTNPTQREKLVNAMIKGGKNPYVQRGLNTGAAIGNIGLSNLLEGNEANGS